MKFIIAAFCLFPLLAFGQIETPGSGTSSSGSGSGATLTEVTNIVLSLAGTNAPTATSTNAIGVAFTNLLWGRTLFVDSINGRNVTAIRGDAAKPWRDVAFAASNAVAGDTVRVRPGRYTETVPVKLAHGVSLVGDDPMTTIIERLGPDDNDPVVSVCSTGTIKGLTIRGWAGTTGVIFPIKTFYNGANRAATNFLVEDCIIQGDTDCFQAVDAGPSSGRFVTCRFLTQWDALVTAGPHYFQYFNCEIYANPSGSTNDRVSVIGEVNCLKTSGGCTNAFYSSSLIATNGWDALVSGAHIVQDQGSQSQTNWTFLRNSWFGCAGTNTTGGAISNSAAFPLENSNSNNVIRLVNCNRQTIFTGETNYAVGRNDGLVMVTNGSARVYTLPNIAPHGRADFDGLELTFHDFNGTASGTNIWLVTQLGQKFINGPTQTNMNADYGYLTLRVRGTNWIPVGSYP